MPAWYHAADAFAFRSVNEGFGLVALEVMAAGLPVVLTRLAVFAKYVRFGEDALVMARGDDHSLAGALETAARTTTCGRRCRRGSGLAEKVQLGHHGTAAHRHLHELQPPRSSLGTP
jgi:glycosyltransferase involved in cell wall biosynthesis